MRAKFRVETVIQHKNETGVTHEEITLFAVSDKPFDQGGNSEDNSFARWTPSGKLTMVITNPALFGKLKVGEKFYLDFTPAAS